MPGSATSGPRKEKTVTSIIRDADLSNPEHDNILIWLYANLDLILGNAGRWTWDDGEVSKMRGAASAAIAEEITNLNAAIAASDERKSKTRARNLSESEIEREVKTYREKHYLRASNPRFEEEVGKHLRLTFLTDDIIYERAESLLQSLKKLELPAPPEFPGCIIENKKWQHAVYQMKEVRSGRERQGPLLAFIDLAARFRSPVLTYSLIGISLAANIDKLKEPVARWNLGYSDIWTNYYDVRAEIASIGALVREVGYIREEVGLGVNYVVVSPDDRFEDVLVSQGIDFLKYEPDLVNQLEETERYLAPTQPGDVDHLFRYDSSVDDERVLRLIEPFDEIE